MIKKVALLALVVIVASSAVQGDTDVGRTGNFCQGCRSIVSLMSHFNSSQDQESLEQYKEVFKGFCEQYYPASVGQQQSPCPILVESLFYGMKSIDPIFHCDQIGACDKPQVARQALRRGWMVQSRKHLENKGSEILCEACEQVVTQVQGQLEDPKMIANIHQQVDAFCEYLRAIGEDKQCRAMLDQYIDEAIDFVKKLQPLQYCQSIQLCSPTRALGFVAAAPKNSVPSPSVLAAYEGFGLETRVTIGGKVVKDAFKPASAAPKKTGASAPTCSLCTKVVKQLLTFVNQSQAEVNIRDGLDKVCELVYRRGPKFEQCEEMVKAYAKELEELLVEEASPELICMMLELCHYDTNARKLIREEPMLGGAEEPINLGQLISMLEPTIQLGSMRNCVECKLFIEYLKNAIEEPKNKEFTKNWLLANLCDHMQTPKNKVACQTMVNNYADIFFKAIAQELDPKTACVDLHACKQGRFLASERVIDAAGRQSTFKGIPVESWTNINQSACDQCVDVVTKIDEYFASHPVDHDVSTLIDQVCNKIPDESTKNACTLIIKTFGQDIALAISTMDNPRQLCSKIMLC